MNYDVQGPVIDYTVTQATMLNRIMDEMYGPMAVQFSETCDELAGIAKTAINAATGPNGAVQKVKAIFAFRRMVTAEYDKRPGLIACKNLVESFCPEDQNLIHFGGMTRTEAQIVFDSINEARRRTELPVIAHNLNETDELIARLTLSLDARGWVEG